MIVNHCWFSAAPCFRNYVSHTPGDARQVCFCSSGNPDKAGPFVCEVIDDFKHPRFIVNCSQNQISEYAFHSESIVRLALMQNKFAPITVTQ